MTVWRSTLSFITQVFPPHRMACVSHRITSQRAFPLLFPLPRQLNHNRSKTLNREWEDKQSTRQAGRVALFSQFGKNHSVNELFAALQSRRPMNTSGRKLGCSRNRFLKNYFCLLLRILQFNPGSFIFVEKSLSLESEVKLTPFGTPSSSRTTWSHFSFYHQSASAVLLLLLFMVRGEIMMPIE